jgi:peptidoglycan biosynthesis protein MviN/MurJ (putative lipid II flippase)
MAIIAAAAVAAVAVETAMFLFQLSREGRPDFAVMAGSFLRLALAGGAAAAVLWASGLGWVQALPPALLAVAWGAAIAATCAVSFLSAVFVLWALAGRPTGVETRIMLVLAEPLEASPYRLAAVLGRGLRRLAGAAS